MFTNKPIKIAKDIEGVRRSALWHLSRRDHSEAELLKKLQRKTDNNEWIETIINECLDLNYLNDERFTETFLRSSQNKGHGLSRIRQDLKNKGIDQHLTLKIMEENEFDYVVTATSLLKNKYDEAIANQYLKQKAIGFLQAKGHSFDIITLAIDEHNTAYPTPKFDDIEQACSLLYKKFKNSIKDQKQKNKALRLLISHGYDYSKSNQAIKLFNEQFT